MTSLSEKQKNDTLINYERTWRTVICLNPSHDTVQFNSNEIGTIGCPTCGEAMVVLIKPVIVIKNELD